MASIQDIIMRGKPANTISQNNIPNLNLMTDSRAQSVNPAVSSNYGAINQSSIMDGINRGSLVPLDGNNYQPYDPFTAVAGAQAQAQAQAAAEARQRQQTIADMINQLSPNYQNDINTLNQNFNNYMNRYMTDLSRNNQMFDYQNKQIEDSRTRGLADLNKQVEQSARNLNTMFAQANASDSSAAQRVAPYALNQQMQTGKNTIDEQYTDYMRDLNNSRNDYMYNFTNTVQDLQAQHTQKLSDITKSYEDMRLQLLDRMNATTDAGEIQRLQQIGTNMALQARQQIADLQNSYRNIQAQAPTTPGLNADVPIYGGSVINQNDITPIVTGRKRNDNNGDFVF